MAINSKELLIYSKNLSLLFVEDYEELRISTTKILNNLFQNVISTKNGADALEIYNTYCHL